MKPYTKRDVSIPRLAGAGLRALVAALETPGLGRIVQKQMMQNVGIPMLRERAATAPQWTPLRLFPRIPTTSAPAPLDLAAIARTGAVPSGPPSIARLAQAYAAGTRTPEDIAERVIAAVADSERHAPPFRFFISHDPDDVRAQARASAARHAAGKPRSVLDGVPVAVKDEVDQQGYGTTGGTQFLGKDKARTDAFAVAQLRAHGAVLIGKANMHELGIGTTGINPHHGTPRNPHDPTRHTGGSSSGSGALVASGIVPLALGADGGGSIRNPASLCGVVGLKPTFGRISEHGAVPICWSVAHLGSLASTVADCAIGHLVMSGADAHDENSQHAPPVVAPRLDGDVRGLRVGVFRPWIEDSDADVVSAVSAALSRLEARGAVLVDVVIPDLDLLRVVHLITIGVEMAAAQEPHFAARRALYALDTRVNLGLARGLTPLDYVMAQRHRTALCDAIDDILARVDVIASPAVGCTAPPVRADAAQTGESDLALLLKIMRFAPMANITGLPALSVPCGRGAGGLPVGLMLMGRAFDEARLLDVAFTVERDVENDGWLVPKHHWPLW